jgi:hypothetical protein
MCLEKRKREHAPWADLARCGVTWSQAKQRIARASGFFAGNCREAARLASAVRLSGDSGGGWVLASKTQAHTAYDLSKQPLIRGRRHRDDARRMQRLRSLSLGVDPMPSSFCLPAKAWPSA